MKILNLLTALCFSLFLMPGCYHAQAASRNAFDYGTQLYNQKKYTQAIKEFETARKKDDKAPVSFWLGRCYYELAKYDQAVEYFEAAENYPWLAYAYYKGGHDVEAAGICKKAVMEKGASSFEASDWQKIVELSDKLGQVDLLIFLKRKEIESAPKKPVLYTDLARLYNRNGQYQEAVASAQKSLELKPDNDLAFNELGWAYTKIKSYDNAISAFKKSLEINPVFREVYDRLGYTLAVRGDFPGALVFYKKSFEFQPKPFNIQTVGWLSLCYYFTGRYQEALSFIDKVIDAQSVISCGLEISVAGGAAVITKVRPQSYAEKSGVEAGDRILRINKVPVQTRSAEKLSKSLQGAPGTSITLTLRKNNGKQIDKIVVMEPVIQKEAAEHLAIRALIYRAMGKRDQFGKDAADALALNPDLLRVQLAFGLYCLDNGRYEEAAGAFKNDLFATGYPAGFGQITLARALAVAKGGKSGEAADIFMKMDDDFISSKNSPLSADYSGLLEEFKLLADAQKEQAAKLEAQAKYTEELPVLSKALAVTAEGETADDLRKKIFEIVLKLPAPPELPEEARKYMLRSELRLKDKDYVAAISELKQAVKRAPYVAVLYFNIGIYYENLKKYEQAIKYMNLFLQAAPDAPNAREVKDKVIEWELIVEKTK